MVQQNGTIAAIATPPGVGGIAVVRISGSGAYSVAEAVFRPKNPNKSLRAASGYTALFGYFVEDGALCDEVVALCFRAPHSYTGEDVVELSCHGGSAVSARLLRACCAAGAAPAGPGEFTKRAFLSGRISLTQAEAVMDLINATSRQAAAAAAAAMEGALYAKIKSVQENLVSLAGHIAAYTDYPEEDVPELSMGALEASLGCAKAALDKLIAGYDAGAVLRRGVDTAIIGSPNVGKSTLLKLLAGLIEPVCGTVTINDGGCRIYDADSRWKADRLAYVHQESTVFNETLRDNITLHRPWLTDDDIVRACEVAGINEGMMDPVVGRPDFLLMDEPTSALDNDTERHVMTALLDSDNACIVVAHRLASIRDFDRIHVMDHGQIVESGTHDELLQAGGLYSRLYRQE